MALKGKLVKEILEKIKNSVIEISKEKIIPSKFATRDTEPYIPITGVQDRHFPSKEALSYENYLTDIFQRDASNDYNFVFSNGADS